MLSYSKTQTSGNRAEALVSDTLKRYTKHVYKNVRVDTLYTKSGTTEIDVLAALADVLLVVEVKNVAQIDGNVGDMNWRFVGLETGEKYSALNVFTQNRIHVRSLKSAWFANRGEIPCVISTVVVPNDCVLTDELREAGILTMQEFAYQVSELAQIEPASTYGYALDFVVKQDGGYISRKDFG